MAAGAAEARSRRHRRVEARGVAARARRRVAALRFALCATLLACAPAAAAPAAAQEVTRGDAPFRVRYRSAETVYLDAGRAAGIEVGDRLEVLHGGEPVARLEVIYAAQNSASCRVVEGDSGAVAVGDPVRPAAGGPAGRERAPEAAGPPAAEAPGARRPAPAPAYRARSRPANRLGGSLTLDYDRFDDGSERGADWQRRSARLNLRVDDLAGTGHDLRVRLRVREDERERPLTAGPRPGGVPETESRDRLYELALIYEPDDRRYGYRVGRLLAGPYVGVGYLDGALGRFSVSPRLDVGAFAGARPDVADLGFESGGSKAGLFVRWSPAAGADDPGQRAARARFAQRGEPFELFVAGVREEPDSGSAADARREYVAIETRWVPGSRWAFYQRAEIDLEPPPGGADAGESSRLSQLSLSAVGTLSPAARVRIVYHRTDPFLFEEEVDPDLPEARFEDLLRQGVRAGLDFGRPGGATVGLDAGVREDESDRDPTASLRLYALHPRAFGGDWSLSASALGFTGELFDGALVQARVARRLGRGHELSLAAGGSGHRESAFEDEELVAWWARAGAWFELPANLFGRAEFEVADGDGREGQRLSTSLGWRF